MFSVLIVVAKQPVPGQAKTRLCPPLSPEQAAELYACFLRDTLEVIRQVDGVQRVVGYLPAEGLDYFRSLAPDMELVVQMGNTLGERLDDLLASVLAGGASKAVVIGSDSPTLPAAYLAQSFDNLDAADVVIGPALDGGYYLIGVKRPQPRLLRDVPMSTPHVLADTLALAEETGLKVSILDPWYDVDTPADLIRLRAELAGPANGTAADTRAWLLRHTWLLDG